jgi:O-6-methylguanine DNA methyltransferase
MKLMSIEPYRGRAWLVDTPIGRVGLVENGTALTHLVFDEKDLPAGAEMSETPLLAGAAEQLHEYFAGRRTGFDLPLAPFGTDFQRRVWEALRRIPYGRTVSYRDIAEEIGSPRAFRAVGQANNRNPIAVIIPCHRVLGQGGQLTGYGGGLSVKEYLLSLEEDIVCGRLRSCPEPGDD